MTAVTPLQLIANAPYRLGSGVSDVVASRDTLQQRNAALERRILELSQMAQQYLALQAENERLRELLGSQARLPEQVLIAEIVGLVPAPNTHQVVLDKGETSGVQVGHAVIDAEGLFGQVVEVGRYTSRVLQITDSNHAVPVQVLRNGVRSIAGGTGQRDSLQLENVSVTADIREGDLLETSGLGGRFPPGYPVGVVDSVLIQPTAAFAAVTVRPSAELDRSRHVLVVLGDSLDLIEVPALGQPPAAVAPEAAAAEPAAADAAATDAAAAETAGENASGGEAAQDAAADATGEVTP